MKDPQFKIVFIDNNETILLHALLVYETTEGPIIIWLYLTSFSSGKTQFLSSYQPFIDKDQYIYILDEPILIDKAHIKDLPDDLKDISNQYLNNKRIKKLTILVLNKAIPFYDGRDITEEEINQVLTKHNHAAENQADNWFMKYKPFADNIRQKGQKDDPLAIKIFIKLINDKDNT
jgi:hypothetical protein